MASQSNKAQPSVVHAIESRVEQLIADHKRLCELNAKLISQRDQLQAYNREKQERIAQLERDIALSELRAGLSNDGKVNPRARAYINRLMREVDSCITLLSSPGGE